MIDLVSTCPPHWYPILMSRSYRGSCPRSKQRWPSCGVRVSYCAIFIEHLTVENIPLAASDADHSDRRAGQSDQDVDVLDDNPEQRQNSGRSGVARLGGGLAALNGAGAARTARAASTTGSGGGDSKDCEGRECEELGEHGV